MSNLDLITKFLITTTNRLVCFLPKKEILVGHEQRNDTVLHCIHVIHSETDIVTESIASDQICLDYQYVYNDSR